MAVTIPQVNTSPTADTFAILYQNFNLVANAMSTVVVTVNANTSGSVTTGNAHVAGIWSATILATPTLRGGNVAVANVLGISSNVLHVGSNQSTWGNSTVNTVINSTAISVNTAFIANLVVENITLPSGLTTGAVSREYITTTTTGLTSQTLDAFLLANARCAEYMISIKDNVANNYQVSTIALIHDGTAVTINEFAVMATNNVIGVFTGTANATHGLLKFAPTTSANTTLKAAKTSIGV